MAVLGIGIVAGYGCYSGTVDRLCLTEAGKLCDAQPVTDVPVDVPVETGGDVGTDIPVAPDTGPIAGLSGDPCKEDKDCIPGTWMTTDYLKTFGLAYEVPGGMCSALGCTTDAECGDKAVCFDSSPFSGMALNLCLRLCGDWRDCRYQGYGCFGTGKAGELKACLPDSIIEAILCDPSELCKCGDGICAAGEKAVGSCAEDCQ